MVRPQHRLRDVPTARRWIGLAAGSLLLAGVLSLLLVIGRTPAIAPHIDDALLFRRFLVVHVDLALVVWFYALLAGLFALLPSAARATTLAAPLAAIGVATMVAGGFVRGAAPILSNYVPVIDHPLYLVGLALFAGGVALQLLGRRLVPRREEAWSLLPPEAQTGIRVAAAAFLLALATLGIALVRTPRFLAPGAYFEALFWGPGHVLQFASVAAMLAAWIVLLRPILGRSPFPGALFALLAAPLPAAPLLALAGTTSSLYRGGSTRLMELGIFPAVVVALALSLRALRRCAGARSPQARLRIAGFAASAALSVLGFLLGASIDGSNTMVPAHYHASLGGVSAAFMALIVVLLEPLGLRAPAGRLARLAPFQPALYGAGQALFALGFGLAGSHGMARKAYGAEQQVRTAAEWIGLTGVAIGGLVAVAGGVLFLVIVSPSVASAILGTSTRSDAWADDRIPSRG